MSLEQEGTDSNNHNVISEPNKDVKRNENLIEVLTLQCSIQNEIACFGWRWALKEANLSFHGS